MLEIPLSSYIFTNLFIHNFGLTVLASRTVRADPEEEL